MSTSEQPVVVAKISTVYGVKGWVKIHAFTDPIDNFFGFSNLLLRRGKKWGEIEFDACRRHGKGIVAHIKGVDDRELAREYSGLELAVAADQLPALADDEYYWHQLVSLKVYAQEQLLGAVDHLIETGANDVLVVKPCQGSIDQRERLIPYLPGDFVQNIDLHAGTMQVDWDPEFCALQTGSRTMDIAVVTLFPEMFAAISEYGVSGRAVQKGAMTLSCINPRDFTHDRHQTVDDRPFGGGPGMVMKVEPLSAALNAAREKLGKPAKTIYLSPQGRPLDQAALATLAGDEALIFLAGRYEGVDERLIEREIDEEWSIGDYVISGGELAAMVMIDGISRLLPGVLGHEQSAEQDSFAEGLLDCPHYTRPEVWGEDTVPEVLRSGNHGAIRRWRHKQALGRTYLRRPDLLDTRELSDEEQTLLAEYLRERDD